MSQNKEKVTTPAGIAKYPRLNTPDTKWKKEGQFKVTLVLDEAARGVTKFIAFIRSLEKQAQAEAMKNPKNKKFVLNESIRPALDDNGDEIAGSHEITFKTTASGVREKDGTRWERKIRMFDAKGLPTEAKVGSGSKLKVSFTHDSYVNPGAKAYGVSLYLEAVQIIDLVEFSAGADASDYGFSEEEGSFEADGSEFADESESNETEETEETEEPADEPEQDPEPEEEAPKPKAKVAPKAAAKPAARQRGQF